MSKQFAVALKGKNAPDGFDASFTASTPAIDRHETVIPQANWKLGNFNANPIIGYNHQVWGGAEKSSPDDVIGKGRAYINSVGNLQLDVKFDDVSGNETAEKVKAKIEGGFLKSVSVGFVEKSDGRWLTSEGKEVNPIDADLYEYGEVELMEVSVVNLPANPEALVMSKDAEIDELRKEIKSLEKFKKELKDVGETMTTVGATMSLFEADTTGNVETDVEFIDKDIEDLEDEKIEQLYKQRKRKARNRARRINL